MNILKQWWFWVLVAIVLAVLLFTPIKACGIINPTDLTNPSVTKVYITYFDYFTKGCVM